MKVIGATCVPLASGAQYDAATGKIVGDADPWQDVARPLSRQMVFLGHEGKPWSVAAQMLARHAVASRLGMSEVVQYRALHLALGRAITGTLDPARLEAAYVAAAALVGVVDVPMTEQDERDLRAVDEITYVAQMQVLLGFSRDPERIPAEALATAVEVVEQVIARSATWLDPCAAIWWKCEREMRAIVAPDAPPPPIQAWERTAEAERS